MQMENCNLQLPFARLLSGSTESKVTDTLPVKTLFTWSKHGLSFKTLFEECREFLGRAIFWRMDMLTCFYGICFRHLTSQRCDGKFRLSDPKDTFNLKLSMIHCYLMLCFLQVPFNYQSVSYVSCTDQFPF